MMNVIQEYYQFLADSFQVYSEGNLIWLLYPAALLCILIWGNLRDRLLFIGSLAVEFLTVFNPFFVKILIEKFSFANRYLRFFWMNLFFVTIAYAMVMLVFKLKNNWLRIVAGVLCIVLIVVLGNPVFWGEEVPPYREATNGYFINDEILELSPLFHQEGYKQPKILYGGLMLVYRQYDPTVKSLISRKVYQYVCSMDVDEFKENSTLSEGYKNILLVYHYGDYSIPQEDFMKALRKHKARYIVTNVDAPVEAYLRDAEGLEEWGETASYRVWRIVYPNRKDG